MKRFALLAVLLVGCAKRSEEAPAPAPEPSNAVVPIEKGPASKFQGLKVQKPLVNHIPGKDPVAAAPDAAPSAK